MSEYEPQRDLAEAAQRAGGPAGLRGGRTGEQR
jgi:hypothetical protein